MPKVRWAVLHRFCSKFHTLSSFQQCKNVENRLRFDKVTESLKVGTFFETQCRFFIAYAQRQFDVCSPLCVCV